MRLDELGKAFVVRLVRDWSLFVAGVGAEEKRVG
jgi:hypothetical protein